MGWRMTFVGEDFLNFLIMMGVIPFPHDGKPCSMLSFILF